MQIIALILPFLASVAIAGPAKRGYSGGGGGGGDGGGDSDYAACTGTLYSELQCCATDVLGVADLDCESPSSIPTSADDFQSICTDVGKSAVCCVLPVLGQSVLCETPVGL